MSKYKTGDKVKVISCERKSYWYSDLVGKEFILLGVDKSFGPFIQENEHFGRSFFSECDIEIVQEKEQMKSEAFNLKKNPWYITFSNEEEFNLIQEWLKSNGLSARYSENYDPGADCLTLSRSAIASYIRDSVVCAKGCGAKEIKLTFKTVVDSVEYPCVKSERDLKIEELQATIEKAKQQIEQLKEIK